jgi:hypothetical protein
MSDNPYDLSVGRKGLKQSHGLTGRAVMQKQPRIEVPSILGMIHSFPCFATFCHTCNQHDGCHPTHYNWLDGGKGVGKKTSDFLVASMCANAHWMIDGRVGHDTLPKDERQYHWLNAYIATWDYAWKTRKVRIA